MNYHASFGAEKIVAGEKSGAERTEKVIVCGPLLPPPFLLSSLLQAGLLCPSPVRAPPGPLGSISASFLLVVLLYCSKDFKFVYIRTKEH